MKPHLEKEKREKEAEDKESKKEIIKRDLQRKRNAKKKSREAKLKRDQFDISDIKSREEIRREILEEIYFNLQNRDYNSFIKNIKRVNINDPLDFILEEEVRKENFDNAFESRVKRKADKVRDQIEFLKRQGYFTKNNPDISKAMKDSYQGIADREKIILKELKRATFPQVAATYAFQCSKGIDLVCTTFFNSQCKVPKSYKMHLLAYCLAKCDIEAAKILLEHGANINITILDDLVQPHTLLHEYINQNNMEVVELLLKNGMNPDIIDSLGYTPLNFAIALGNKEIVNKLVQCGADIELTPKLNIKKIASVPGGKNVIQAATIPPFHRSMLDNPKITLDLMKAIILQGGIDKMKRVLAAECIVIIGDKGFILDGLGVALHYCKDEIISKLVTSVAEICLSSFRYKELYEAILFNDTSNIEQFFVDKSPQMVCDIFKYKIPIISHRYESKNKVIGEGFYILQFAKAMEYPEIEDKLKQIYREALDAVRSQPLAERVVSSRKNQVAYNK